MESSGSDVTVSVFDGAGGLHLTIGEHRVSALKAAAGSDPYLVPIELATLLAMGGESAIEDTAARWLSLLDREPTGGNDDGPSGVIDHFTKVFSLEDEIADCAEELVMTRPARPITVPKWRNLELGERVQVLLLIAHVVVAQDPKAGDPLS